MEQTTEISFIIVNHKNEKFIPQCLSTLAKNCEGINFEIIVVNNDNSNSSFPSAKIINLEKNLGYGHACNAGVKIATGETLCFLNPDTEILSDIKDIVGYFDSQENIGIIGPKLITEKNEVQWWCAGVEMNLWNIVKNKLGFIESKKIWNSPKTIECDWVSGACLFIHKNIFEELNGFDEKFFMYFEDMDLCRAREEKGYKIIYFPAWNVKHLGGKSFDNRLKQKKLYYSSLIHYFKKNLM